MDLGTAFAVSVCVSRSSEAFVDGGRRVHLRANGTARSRPSPAALQEMGLQAGDHLVVVMRNRYEMATLYWASHMLGLIFTPVSWRASPTRSHIASRMPRPRRSPIDGASGDAAPAGRRALKIDPRRLIVAADGKGEGVAFRRVCWRPADCRPARADEFSTCLMLYTSGTTGRPKGVPRSHRNELAASISHIAQNQLSAEPIPALGVMPLFHTMGVRILLGSALAQRQHSCACRTTQPERGAAARRGRKD